MEECDYDTLIASSFIPLSISSFEKDAQNVLLFPNPAKGHFEIQSQDLEITSIKLYNSLGQIVKSSDTLRNDISDLSNGIYLVLIETGNGSLTKRLVVSN